MKELRGFAILTRTLIVWLIHKGREGMERMSSEDLVKASLGYQAKQEPVKTSSKLAFGCSWFGIPLVFLLSILGGNPIIVILATCVAFYLLLFLIILISIKAYVYVYGDKIEP
jgi:hypothetical protein